MTRIPPTAIRLGPGVYADGETLHIVLDECLLDNGFEPNDENRQALTDAARQLGMTIEEAS